jgi:hypothetical protein
MLGRFLNIHADYGLDVITNQRICERVALQHYNDIHIRKLCEHTEKPNFEDVFLTTQLLIATAASWIKA